MGGGIDEADEFSCVEAGYLINIYLVFVLGSWYTVSKSMWPLLVDSGWGLIAIKTKASLEGWNFEAHPLTSFCPSVVHRRDRLWSEHKMVIVKGKQASPCWNLQKKRKVVKSI